MVQLVHAGQFDLVPKISNLGAGISQGMQMANQFQAGKQKRLEAEQAQAQQGYANEALQGNKEAYNNLNIDMKKKVSDMIATQTEAETAEQKRENEVLTRGAMDALLLKDPVKIRQFIGQQSEKFKAEGRDTSRTDSLLSMNDEQMMQALTMQARMGQELDVLYNQQFSGEDPKVKSEVFDNASKLRNEFEKLAKPFETQSQAFGRIQAAANQPDAAGDLALIFSYMKVLDPGSTVREGEFATAQNADGVGGRIQSLYNNVLRGERLNESQRAQFVGRAEKLYNQAKKQNKAIVSRYTKLAERNNLPPQDVVRNMSEGLNVSDSSVNDLINKYAD